jgi:hypothetical protein
MPDRQYRNCLYTQPLIQKGNHFTTTNQQRTKNAKLPQRDLAADTSPKSGENYRKTLLGTGNWLMILNTFADSGRTGTTGTAIYNL